VVLAGDPLLDGEPHHLVHRVTLPLGLLAQLGVSSSVSRSVMAMAL
jgi:hypothetical protein